MTDREVSETSSRTGALRLLPVAVIAAVVAVWLWGLWYFSPWVAHNDFAIFRMRLEEALDGDVGLVGVYSRLGVFHPGPLREWLFAIPYWVSGRRAAALPATALVFNLTWSGLGLYAAWRCRTHWIAPATAAGLALVVVAMRHQLDSPWNPHLAVVPLYVACAATAMALVGARRAWLASVVGASLAAQLHAAALVVAASLFVVVLVAELRSRRPWWRAPAVGAVLWIGPILDLVNGREANLVRLLTADGGGDRLGATTGAGAVARLLWMPSIVGSVAIEPGIDEIIGRSRLLLVAVVVVLVAVVVWGRGTLRPAAVVGLVVLGAALATAAVFVEPAYMYLFAPLQASAVYALVVAATGLLALVIRAAMPARIGAGAVGLAAVVVVVVSVTATDAHDHESAAYRDLDAERAIEAWLAERPATTVRVVDVEVRGADLAALAAEILARNGIDPRSDRPHLGLDPPTGGGPAIVSVMGRTRDCLLATDAEVVADGRVGGEAVTMFAIELPDPSARECAGL